MSVTHTARARREQPVPSDYTQLLRRIQSEGLLSRRYAFYAMNLVAVLFAFGLVWIVFFVMGDSWLRLIVAAGFGVVLGQVGWLSHDAAHRQIRSGPHNDLLASLLGGLLAGTSATWWMHKHNAHHAAPNHIGRDPDIEPTVVRVFPADKPPRSKVLALFRRHQGWLLIPLLTLQAVGLHAQSAAPCSVAARSRTDSWN